MCGPKYPSKTLHPKILGTEITTTSQLTLPRRTARLPSSRTPGESKLAHPIRRLQRALAGSDLAWGTAVARRDVHDGVAGEEVAGSQEEGDGLDGHDGEVLGRGDVGYAERVPEDNVFLLDGLCAVADPFGNAGGGLA